MKFSSMNNYEVLKEIGVRTRRERLNQNLTQETLSQRAGVSRRVVLDLERGKVVVSAHLLKSFVHCENSTSWMHSYPIQVSARFNL